MNDSEKSHSQLIAEGRAIIQAKKDADEKEVAPYKNELQQLFKKYAFADEALRKAISVGNGMNKEVQSISELRSNYQKLFSAYLSYKIQIELIEDQPSTPKSEIKYKNLMNQIMIASFSMKKIDEQLVR